MIEAELTLIEEFAGAIEGLAYSALAGQHTIVCPRESLMELAQAAKEAGFEVCADVTAVDYLSRRAVRFMVVINLLSHSHNLRVRIHVPVPDDSPELPSVTRFWPGANFFEREVYDMFGIRFDGHPDLSRILMPDDWEGHPLRKDFGIGAIPVQFKAPHEEPQ